MKSKILVSAFVGMFSFVAATIAQATPEAATAAAAGKVECWVKEGKKDVKKEVADAEACKKAGGHTKDEHGTHK